MMLRVLKIAGFCVLAVFALIGMAFTAVYVGMEHELLNVPGSIIERNAFFGPVPTTSTTTNTGVVAEAGNGCRASLDQTMPCEWNQTAAWDVVAGGLEKDAAIINRVAAETGVPARMIAAAVIPEQIRFFTDNREVFKRYFEPLKILASLSKFSLGVSGIKQETADQIEVNAVSTSSPFYTGETIAALIAYPSDVDEDATLYARLTNEKDHYYSYLYTAIYLKQIIAQWEKAGYEIENRPDVLVTLFNLGFDASEPKANPQVGGASITVGGQSYSFGYLGTLFYNSGELDDLFPFPNTGMIVPSGSTTPHASN
jgi:hypothetical protein